MSTDSSPLPRTDDKLALTKRAKLMSFLVPVIIAALGRVLYQKRHDLCTLTFCLTPILACARNADCKVFLDCLDACKDENSAERKTSRDYFFHTQHPAEMNLCNFLCFDKATHPLAEAVIECTGRNKVCLEQARVSDQCAMIQPEHVLDFQQVAPNFEGSWKKLYSSSWDLWPCQKSYFYGPQRDMPKARPWMTKWPQNASVWRMDFSWTVEAFASHDKVDVAEPYTFEMSSELYPGETWDHNNTGNGVPATLKTRAVMWGLETDENWYFLDYDADAQVLLISVCALTPAVSSYDQILLVFQKEGSNVVFTGEMAEALKRKAGDLVGFQFANLRRIEECRM